MEEPGEQCTVVFALIVTELASGGGGAATTSPPTSQFRFHSCKDDSALFSRFLYALPNEPASRV
jgi:hypothetical protein